MEQQGRAAGEVLVARVLDSVVWTTAPTLPGFMSVHPWGRFEVDGDRIPAADGHSIGVELEDRWGAILDQLSYATAPAAVDSLPRVGIHQMERQSVHLPGSFETARAVGAWHAGQPAVFLIEAGGLVEAAHPITKRGASVYPTSHVPRQA